MNLLADRVGSQHSHLRTRRIFAAAAATPEIDEASFDRMLAVHVKGSFFFTRAVVGGMKRRRMGKINQHFLDLGHDRGASRRTLLRS